MPNTIRNRRAAIVTAGLAAPALAITGMLSGCSGNDEEPGAVEDLMREHGVLRRAILVLRESADRLRRDQPVDVQALHKTAALFRAFGEDYHERKLEEENIFPALRKAGGEVADLVDTLLAQHNRGREIIDYVLAVTTGALADKQALIPVLERFELMYANHAAREDTILFPAWKKVLGPKAVEEAGEKFEDIEKQQFGGDGFDAAVRQMAEIERALGFSSLAQFTAPPRA
jgi:hemerythrin-like domain-containing protein